MEESSTGQEDFSATDTQGLIAKLSHENGQVREQARKELVERGRPVIDDLEPLLESSNERERWEVAKTLAQMRDPQTAEMLAQAMNDDKFDIHWIATEGLIYLREKALPAVLRQVVEEAHNVRVREGATRVLREVRRSLADDSRKAELVQEVLKALHGFHPVEEIAEKAYEALRATD